MRATGKAARVRLRTTLIALTAVAGLAGCGSSGSSATSSTTTSASPSPTASGTLPAGAPAGGDAISAQAVQIQQCLQAAGIAGPGAAMPSAAPSGPPSAGAGITPPGGAGELLNSPQAEAALQACGITLPTTGSGQ